MIIYYIMIDEEKSVPVLKELNVRESEKGLLISNFSDCEIIHSDIIVLCKNISIDNNFKIIFNSNLKDAIRIYNHWTKIYNNLKNKYISQFLNTEESLILNYKRYVNLKKNMTKELKNKSFEGLKKVINC